MKKSALTILGMLLSATVAFAQTETPEYEVLCRMKAKEIAAETYRGCVTEARTTQIEQLKREYQDKLRAMKEDYERELKKLSGAKPVSQSKKTMKKLAKTKPMSKPSRMDEMTVEMKTAPAPMMDESTMDVPEPTPVEDVPTAEGST
jgi:Skp family chaperone for outer membrane proteins